MSRKYVKSLCAVLLILLCASAFLAQKKRTKKQSNGERLITALADSDNLPGLFRIDEGVFAEGSKGISPDVIRILKLGKRAAVRGLAIAALAYLVLFIFELVFGVIYNNDRNSDEIYRLLEVISMMFFYGLFLLGWLIAAIGTAAGARLYPLRLKQIQ